MPSLIVECAKVGVPDGFDLEAYMLKWMDLYALTSIWMPRPTLAVIRMNVFTPAMLAALPAKPWLKYFGGPKKEMPGFSYVPPAVAVPPNSPSANPDVAVARRCHVIIMNPEFLDYSPLSTVLSLTRRSRVKSLNTPEFTIKLRAV